MHKFLHGSVISYYALLLCTYQKWWSYFITVHRYSSAINYNHHPLFYPFQPLRYVARMLTIEGEMCPAFHTKFLIVLSAPAENSKYTASSILSLWTHLWAQNKLSVSTEIYNLRHSINILLLVTYFPAKLVSHAVSREKCCLLWEDVEFRVKPFSYQPSESTPEDTRWLGMKYVFKKTCVFSLWLYCHPPSSVTWDIISSMWHLCVWDSVVT